MGRRRRGRIRALTDLLQWTQVEEHVFVIDIKMVLVSNLGWRGL